MTTDLLATYPLDQDYTFPRNAGCQSDFVEVDSTLADWDEAYDAAKGRGRGESSKHGAIVFTEVRCPSQTKADRQPRIQYKPSCSVWRLALAFCHSVKAVNHSDRLFDLIPSRLGRNRTIDLAAAAFYKASEYRQQQTLTTQKQYQKSYAAALEAVRRSIECGNANCADEVVIPTILLGATVCTEPAEDKVGLWIYIRGASALILNARNSNPQDEPASELTRVALYVGWIATFADPIFRRSPSPFEEVHWLNMEPPKVYATVPDAIRLRILGNELFIRLPRLVAAVRDLRDGRSSSAVYSTALRLARHLLLLNDPASESHLLHRLKIKRTVHPVDRLVVPYSFEFPEHQFYEAAVYYWATQTVLNRLCLQLCTLNPPDQPPANIFSRNLSLQNLSFASNLLMAMTYATGLGRLGSYPMYSGGIALWGVVHDCGTKLKNTPVSLVRPLVIRMYGELVVRSFRKNIDTFCAVEMDAAVDMLAGGPQSELLTEIFCWNPQSYGAGKPPGCA